MELLMNQKSIIQPNSNLTDLVKDLNNILTALQPKSETAQLITYTFVATAVVGIFVYQYIKSQEHSL